VGCYSAAVTEIKPTVPFFNWMRSPKWQFLLRVSSTGAGALVSRGDAVALLPDQVTHRGMPAVGEMPRKVALAERIPPLIFYIPLAILGILALHKFGYLAVGTIIEAIAIGIAYHIWSEWNHRRRATRRATTQ